jgi:hypothetical protein
MPITVEGQRDAVPELDDWSLKLVFSNDLFLPIGVDNTGGLAQPRDPNYPLVWDWDQPSRTLTIRATNVPVSDQTKLSNNLLLSVVMRAYLTTDTVVTVTPIFTFERHPCAYNLQPFQLSIPYADECGGTTLRSFMRGENTVLDLRLPTPDPIDIAEHNALSIPYVAHTDGNAVCAVLDVGGRTIQTLHFDFVKGLGSFVIPASRLSGGVAFLRWQVRDGATGSTVQKTLKVAVRR